MNDHKRFTWCETSFLQRFWDDKAVKQNIKDRLQALLWEGKIEMVGGGWVQHDDSLTNYKMQVLQMETGFKWLYDTFPFLKGKVNTLWQIDPFGASDLMPLLFESDFKYALLNRVGDHIKDQLKSIQNQDFLWTNPFDAHESGILTHLTNKHYATE